MEYIVGVGVEAQYVLDSQSFTGNRSDKRREMLTITEKSAQYAKTYDFVCSQYDNDVGLRIEICELAGEAITAFHAVFARLYFFHLTIAYK